MSEPDRTRIDAARRAVAEADAASRRAAFARIESERRLRQLARMLGPRDERLLAAHREHERRSREAERASAAVAAARSGLPGRLAEFLAVDEGDDAARLDAQFPIALFPVRVETRFAFEPAGAALQVRVYPDAVLADAHDPLLTEEERDAGFDYWRRAPAGEAAAWREIVRDFRPPRAAWIVRATTPVSTGPDGAPVFPEVGLRPDSWDRPPLARLLPDRWVVVCLRGGAEVARAVSAPVAEPLALGPDPHFQPTGSNPGSDGLELDDGMLWAVDFARALEVGMAVRVPLAEAEARAGFDRVLVLGLKTSLLPEQAGGALEELLERHRFGAGWAFLRQGTPTNNTERIRSAYPPADADGLRSFAVERGEPLDLDGGDGVRFARAFGIDRAAVAHVEGADRAEGLAGEGMAVALWPVAFGYFLRQMMAPHVSEAAIAATREHFAQFVRGRGPLPAFRVASQPYGVLPVTSLSRFTPRPGARGLAIELPRLLEKLRPTFTAQAAFAPHVRPEGDPDADLLAVLAMDASSGVVRVRKVVGPDFRSNLMAFLAIEGGPWNEAGLELALPVMSLVGHPELRPRILQTTFDGRTGRYRFPLVVDGPLSEEAPLPFDYVAWVRGASVEDLRAERIEGRETPNALLYRMLRHARLSEIDRAAVDLLVRIGAAVEAVRLEPELVGIADETIGRRTPWERLGAPVAAVTGTRSVGDFLADEGSPAPEAVPVRDHSAALARLEGLPTAELQRLFTETLDACSHRFDAWATSLATRRLEEMREAQPAGIHVGAYGWVEDLRPEPTGAVDEPVGDGRTARLPIGNGGFVQTPSLDHAAAAAILRNAYLTRGEGARDAYAVDLSSRRVRAALAVLDAVREGQALGAVLGYRFERGLQENGAPRLIEPLRGRFPSVANKAESSSASPAAIAARSVVDGKALRDAWKAGTLDLDSLGIVAPTSGERAVVERELARLDEAIDAVADLLLVESVYQIVSGNTGAANASLDAMARGVRPPDPAVARSPASGIPLTHRVAIVLGDGLPGAPGWSATPTPRAAAEPLVDAWAGRVLGDPHAV
ncbi:MAG TPA: hypothetical protein VFC77_01545, partial [Myxococcota bacterium]|nr:hypothetical protein [Myxococcota bacterium]